MWSCRMFLILRWDSEAASISCARCFDLSLGCLSTFYHLAQCGVWEASTLIMYCCFSWFCFAIFVFFCCCFFMSLYHAEAPESHVVYCRLTKGKLWHQLMWMRCHNTTAGTRKEFQSGRSEIKKERHSGGEKDGKIWKNWGAGKEENSDIPPHRLSLTNPA